VVLGERGREVVAYPVLEDHGDSVALRHLTDARSAAAANRRGYARLALLKLGQLSRQLKKEIAADNALGLLFAPLGSAEQFRDELLRASAWACFFEENERPRDAAAFAARLDARRGELHETFTRVRDDLRAILEERLALVRALDAASSPAYAEAVADIRRQLDWLVPPDLLSTTPSRRLPDIPRYLAAARYRLENLQGKVARDGEQTRLLAAFTERVERLGEALGRDSEEWLDVRFLLEEVRVSVFAERLGARTKASPTRLDRRLAALEREHGLV
jgi:ATP-dependent helicase HrpA